MKKRVLAALMAAMMVFSLAGCGSTKKESKSEGKTTVHVFIAASLNTAMTEVAKKFNEKNPDIKILYSADSSGKLMEQIEEGFDCDIFFSAAQKQMDQLEKKDKLVEKGTRANIVNNQVVVITRKDSNTQVTGLANLEDAKSIALADGSVPVGKYTRQALMNIGKLTPAKDPSTVTTEQVSKALGGVEISEQGNVSQVLTAVKEGKCEVGTTYYSDTYGFEKDIKILQKVNYDATGNVIYPAARIKNDEASKAENKAADKFMEFIKSKEAKKIFKKYYFDTNVK